MVLDEACVFVEDSSQQFQNTVSSLGSEGKNAYAAYADLARQRNLTWRRHAQCKYPNMVKVEQNPD